jgi:SAM-dependent methyltransferase
VFRVRDGVLWHLDHIVEPADVPSGHDFFDRAYVRGWAEDTSWKNPQRPTFFDAFVNAIDALGRDVIVLDLGSGPGLLAEQILDRCTVSAYCLLDISSEMHDLSRERLSSTRRPHGLRRG